eukprot:3476755-Pyramimonas_sp.AAC.1
MVPPLLVFSKKHRPQQQALLVDLQMVARGPVVLLSQLPKSSARQHQRMNHPIGTIRDHINMTSVDAGSAHSLARY